MRAAASYPPPPPLLSCPTSLLYRGFAIVDTANPLDTVQGNDDAGGGGDPITHLASTVAREWFATGVMREHFTLTIEETEEGGGGKAHRHTSTLGHAAKISRHVNNKTATTAAADHHGGNGAERESDSYYGVESFTIRLPATPCRHHGDAPFPWPITFPSLEEDCTKAFVAFEALGWRFMDALVEAIVLEQKGGEQEGNGQCGGGADGGHREALLETIRKQLADLRCSRQGNGSSTSTTNTNNVAQGGGYTDSILFLRHYIGAKPTAHPHTDSGIITMIPFEGRGEAIRGLETRVRRPRVSRPLGTGEKGVMLHGEGGGEADNDDDDDEWCDVAEEVASWTAASHTRAASCTCSDGGGKVLVMLGEMGEAILRALMPTKTASASPSWARLPSHPLATLHRVSAPHDTTSSPSSSPSPPCARVTTPFQLRVPFHVVPGFLGFDIGGGTKSIQL